jgi:hypothetical protein
MKMTFTTFTTTLVLAFAAGTAQAGTFDSWSLNGNATLRDSGDTLRLTDTNSYQRGSAWAPDKVSLAHDFSVAFSFRIGDGTAADGLTFTVHDNVAGTATLGADGGYLGYLGVNKSVAFLYDTWENGLDTDRIPGPNTSVAVGGNLSPWGGATVGHAYELRDKVLYSWVDYSAATHTYSMYISDTALKPLVAQETLDGALSDLSSTGLAYIGFTAATGGATDNHDILSVSITAVPEADALMLALGGLPLVLGSARFLARRRNRSTRGN